MPKKSVLISITMIIVTAVFTVGCNQPFSSSEKSQATPTMDANGEFPGTLPADMDDAFAYGMQTLTAIAVSGTSAGDTPAAGTAPTIQPLANTTSTPIPAMNITATSSLPMVATNTPVPFSNGTKPSTYTLKQGEFPYCIARRFNVNPDELLSLNGLTDAQAQIYDPGLTLKIPQSGAAFPASRSLHNHPTTYTTPKNMTVYGIACYFGDIDPAAIVNANNIADLYNIPIGTTLQIP